MIGPKCEISSISSVNHFINIVCDEDVIFNTVDDGDISIEIEGPLSPYSYSFIIDNTTGFSTGTTSYKYAINIVFESSLFGENEELIKITYNDLSILQDIDGNYLQTSYMEVEVPFQLIVLSEDEKAAASSQSSASIISLLLTFGTSVLIQMVLGGTIEATWLLLGTIQLMSLLPLLNMNLPANFREFSKNLAILNGEPEAIPNIFEYYYDTLDVIKEPFNAYYEIMNFKTQYLLLNAGRKVMIWTTIFIFSAVTWLVMDITHGVGACGKVVGKIDIKMRYGIIIRAVSQSYVSMVLSTALNVYTISWGGDNVSPMSNIIALIGAVVMMYIPVLAFSTIHKSSNLQDPEFKKRYKTFIVDLKTASPL